jgi:hypothetical protein
MSGLNHLLVIAKDALRTVMDVQPEHPAEEIDYAYWGKDFMTKLVSHLQSCVELTCYPECRRRTKGWR